MAESPQVEAGLAGATIHEDGSERAGGGAVLLSADPPEQAGAASTVAASDPDEEPSLALVGRPTWSFAVSRGVEQASAPPASSLPPAPPASSLPPAPLAPPAPWHPATGPAGARAIPVPSLGPAGRTRHPAAVAALAVLTLGLHSIAWHHRINREMSEFDARLEVSAGRSTLGAAVAWLMGLACTLAGTALILAHLARVGPPLAPATTGLVVAHATVPWAYLMLAGLLAVPYLTLLLAPSLGALLMTLERVRVVEERVGIRADRQLRPMRHACRLLVPVAGGIWHLAALQHRLNRVWRLSDTLAPGPTSR
jgi:hypothetical protein